MLADRDSGGRWYALLGYGQRIATAEAAPSFLGDTCKKWQPSAGSPWLSHWTEPSRARSAQQEKGTRRECMHACTKREVAQRSLHSCIKIILRSVVRPVVQDWTPLWHSAAMDTCQLLHTCTYHDRGNHHPGKENIAMPYTVSYKSTRSERQSNKR